MNCYYCHKKLWAWQGCFDVKGIDGKDKKYHDKCFAITHPKVYKKIRSVEY